MTGRKPGLKSTIWNKKKKQTSNQNRTKKQDSKKWGEAEKPLGQLSTFQHPNHRGARRRRTTARNWKLIWTNNEGKLPNLVKEIDFWEVQEAQRVPKKLDPSRNMPRHIIINLSKIKDKDRLLKAARGKERVTYKGVPIRLSADFSRETLQARRG